MSQREEFITASEQLREMVKMGIRPTPAELIRLAEMLERHTPPAADYHRDNVVDFTAFLNGSRF